MLYGTTAIVTAQAPSPIRRVQALRPGELSALIASRGDFMEDFGGRRCDQHRRRLPSTSKQATRVGDLEYRAEFDRDLDGFFQGEFRDDAAAARYIELFARKWAPRLGYCAELQLIVDLAPGLSPACVSGWWTFLAAMLVCPEGSPEHRAARRQFDSIATATQRGDSNATLVEKAKAVHAITRRTIRTSRRRDQDIAAREFLRVSPDGSGEEFVRWLRKRSWRVGAIEPAVTLERFGERQARRILNRIRAGE
jgi:hypothetical protein